MSLSFVPALPGGQAMTVSYSPDPAADAPVFDLTGDAAPPFADRPVTNYPAAPAVTLSPGDTALTATWTAPLDGGAAINRYQADWRRSGTTDTWTLSDYLDASQPRTYQITGLTNDVSYDVRVRALNTPAPSDFGGPWSAVATATPVEADTTAPTVASSSVDGPLTVTLNFSEQLDTTSVPAASAFEVTLNSGTPFSPTSVAIPSANSSAVELGLPSSGRIDPGDTVSVSYTKPSSNPLQDNPLPVSNAVADFTHTVANVPDAPAAPTAVGRNMSVALSWDTTGIADGGSPITRYEIQHKEASADDSAYGAATAVDAGSLTVVEHTIAGLTNGTSYDVRLRAVNEHGQSAWSPAATVTPDPLPAPVAALTSGTGLGFVVDFSEPLDATKHPPETAFTVSVDGAAVTPNGVLVSGDTVLLTVEDPFAAGADVTVAYTADPSAPIADLVGDTAASFPDLLVKNRPAAPTLTLVPADDRLGASWAEPRTGGSPITGYRMQIKRASQPDSAYASSITGSAGSELHLAADTRSTVFTGLANGTAYDVRIHARNVVAGSPWATGQSTPAERDLIAPALRSDNPIIIIEADPDTVTIFYNEPLDTASVPAAAAFAVTVGSAAATAPDSVLIPADDPDTAGLDESSTVVLVMSADIGAGETVTVAYTAPADNPIRDLAAADNITAGFDSAANTAAGYTAKTATNRPAAPAAPTLTVGDTSLTVAVAAPAADGGSPITGYEVQHKASSAADSVYDSNPTTSVSAGAVNAVIRGLTNGTDYDVRVRAVNAAGPGPWSDAATQAPDTLIAAPATAWAFPGDELVLVRWTPPEGIRDDANLLGYEIQYKSGTQTYSGAERRVTIGKSSGSDLRYEHHIESLTNNTEYTFRVRLRATAGTGVWSDDVTATPVSSSSPTERIVAAVVVYESGSRVFDNPGTRDLLVEFRATVGERFTDSDGDIDFPMRVEFVMRLNNLAETVPVTGIKLKLDEISGCGSLGGSHPDDLTGALRPWDPVLFSGLDGLESLHVDADPTDFGDGAYPAFEATSLRAIEVCGLAVAANLVNANGAHVAPYLNNSSQVRNLQWPIPSEDPSMTLHDPIAGDGSATFTWDSFWIKKADSVYLVWKSGSQQFDTTYPLDRSEGFNHRAPHSHTIEGLDNGTEYTFAVVLYEDGQEVFSLFSNEVTVTPVDTSPPVLESGVVSEDGSSIRLDFDDELDSALPAVSAFSVTSLGHSGVTRPSPSSASLDSADASVLVLVFDMASPVAAGNRVIVGYTAPTVNPLQNVAGLAWAATDFTVANRAAAPVVRVAPRDGALSAAWDEPANGASAITGYEVQYKASSATAYTTVARADATALTELISGLANGAEYEVRVRARNGAGLGPWSMAVSGVPAVAPVPQSDVSSTFVDPHSRKDVVIGFGSKLDTASVPAASAFEVAVGTASAVAPASVSLVADDPDTADVDESATGVVLVMSAEVAAGATVSVSYTKPASAPLRDEGSQEVASFADHAVPNVPAAPGPLDAEPRSGRVRVVWSAAPASGGSPIIGYDVQLQPAPGAPWVAANDDDDDIADDRVLVTGLSDGVDYPFRVRAYNAVGNGPWAQITAAPDPPAAFDSAEVTEGGTTVVLTFSEALDETSVPVTTAFTVNRNNGAGANPTAVAVDGDTVTLTVSPAITAGTTVQVAFADPTKVFADAPTLRDLQGDKLDGDGDGAPGGDIDTAAANLPAAPTLSLTPASGQLTAAWTAPRDGGSAITAYEIQHKLASAPDSDYAASTLTDTNTDPDSGLVVSGTISGLTNDTAYKVRIRAVNAVGKGPWTVVEETPVELDLTAPALRDTTPIYITEADSDTVTIHYNEDLDTASVPAASAFSVAVGAATASRAQHGGDSPR